MNIFHQESLKKAAQDRLTCLLLDNDNYRIKTKNGEEFTATFFVKYVSPYSFGTRYNIFVANILGSLKDNMVFELDDVKTCFRLG